MKEKLRPCKFTEYSGGKTNNGTGYFHCCGLSADESASGNISWSIAIVEDQWGVIHKIDPQDLAFTDIT